MMLDEWCHYDQQVHLCENQHQTLGSILELQGTHSMMVRYFHTIPIHSSNHSFVRLSISCRGSLHLSIYLSICL
jgi:hypothetical protein